MSTPINSLISHTAQRLSPRSSLRHLREYAFAQTEHLLDRQTVHDRLAFLRNHEANLGDVELIELSELNTAQRLQRAAEQNSLTAVDQAEAHRLRHLREAFATPTVTHSLPATQAQAHNLGDTFERPTPSRPESSTLDPSARLAYLRSREAELDDVELVELFELNEAQRLQRASQRQTNPFRPNYQTPANPVLPRNLAGIPMQTHELFGRNLRAVTMQQGSNNTCYLLCALDAILHHPQGERVLNLIRVNRVPNGYTVRFPGHPEPIMVSENSLRGNDVPTSSHIGIPILWNAYFRLPEALHPSMADNTYNAMRRMFGNHVADTDQAFDTTLAESNQLRGMLNDRADIWTATYKFRGQDSDANHYFSIRPNADQSFDLANPRNTTNRLHHFVDDAAFHRQYETELTRINLD